MFAKYMTLFCVLLLVLVFAMSGQAKVEGVRVSTPDTCWYAGNFIDVPLSIEWTDWSKFGNCAEYTVPAQYDPTSSCITPLTPDEDEMCSFEMEIRFNARLMQAVTVTNGELVEEWNWPALYYEIDNSAGIIRIAGASSSCESIPHDPEVLLLVGFLLNGSAGDDTELEVASFTFNEVDPVHVYASETGVGDDRSIGSLTICEHEFVGGMIRYASTDMPVCEAEVQLLYMPDPNVVTPPDITSHYAMTSCDIVCQDDCRGSFMIPDVVDGYEYCLTVYKDDQYDDAISAFDASLILRYVVDQLEFNYFQMCAADVSGDATVSAYDASLILKYLVNRLPDQPYFPKHADRETNWLFIPLEAENEGLPPSESYCYNPLENWQDEQDFLAVILGDVSGNWGATGPVTRLATDGLVDLISRSMPGGMMAVDLTTSTEALSTSFTIRTESATAAVQIVSSLSGIDGWVTAVGDDGTIVRVAAAGTSPAESGTLMSFSCPAGETVVIEDLVVNETLHGGALSLGTDGVTIPESFGLRDNYPNPFNPVTHISFTLPQSADVELTVYNLLGQHVRTLLAERLAAGEYTVEWNATSEAGTTVASGVYFYRLESTLGTETKKMLLLK